MFSMEKIMRTKVGGPHDTLALLGTSLGLLATSPVISPFIAGHHLATALLSTSVGLGSAYLAHRFSTDYREKHMIQTGLNIDSAQTDGTAPIDDGYLLGYRTDTGLPFYLQDEIATRHIGSTGASGVGKTVQMQLLQHQQIRRGGSLVFVDGKMASSNLERIWQLACYYGRENDLKIINPGDPRMSHKYNPILRGDADECSSRILSIIPTTAQNAGADHYRSAANQGLTTLIGAIQSTGLAYNFLDLAILLTNPRALEELQRIVVSNTNNTESAMHAKNLRLLIEQFRGGGKTGTEIDMKRVKEMYGGIGGRCFTFGTGNFGQIMNTYAPDVNLTEDILDGKLIFVQLPTMGKAEAAASFGKMFVGDWRSSIAEIMALPDAKKPKIPCLVQLDEAGSYITDAFSRIFEQSREARLIIQPAVQVKANYEQISEELSEMVTGNTWTKVYFKLGTQASAEYAAEYIGTQIEVTRTLTLSDSDSTSAPTVGIEPTGSKGDGYGTGYGEREQEGYRVSAEDLKALGKGEAIILYGGDTVFNVKVPMFQFDKNLTSQFGKPRIIRTKHREPKGLNLFSRADQFIS